MTQSELFKKISNINNHLSNKIIACAIKEILQYMTISLAKGNKLEIRGFGSFSLHYRAPYTGYNPKTRKQIKFNARYTPHFKPSKQLKNRINLPKQIK